MLDEFVIEGHVTERAPLQATKGNTKRLKKHSLAISVSIFVHLFLVLVLYLAANEQQPKQVQATKKAIQSYLYKMPTKPVKAEPVNTGQTIRKDPPKTEPIVEVKAEIKPEALKQESEKSAEKIKNNNLKQPEVNKASLNVKPANKTIQPNISSYKQLENLRNSINKQMIEKTPSSYQQYRTPSAMNTNQKLVPHSTLQLTPEQEREKKITKMSDDISITKYDNGICTIERKQFVGSPVEGSTSAFSCGESKFDKSFREHMKKVRDKIMPKK